MFMQKWQSYPNILVEEMLVQILSRLPPKSLMRFKCIHTSWCALINNPNFATKHLSVSKHNKISSFTTILFKRYVLRDMNTTAKEDKVLSLFNLFHEDDDNDDDAEDLHVPPSMRLLRIDHYGTKRVLLLGHCDEIICLSDMRERVVLCNPAIKEFKLLPVSNLLLSSPYFTTDDCDPTETMGIGYDLKSKTYKVVRILIRGEEFLPDNRRISSSQIIGKKSVLMVWLALPLYECQAANPICCNGKIYWCAMECPMESIVSYTTGEDDDEVSHELPENCLI